MRQETYCISSKLARAGAYGGRPVTAATALPNPSLPCSSREMKPSLIGRLLGRDQLVEAHRTQGALAW
jgi:hypothetical protein